MLKPNLEENTGCFSLHSWLALISQAHDTSFDFAMVSKMLLEWITIEIVLFRVIQLHLSALFIPNALVVGTFAFIAVYSLSQSSKKTFYDGALLVYNILSYVV